MSSKSNGLDDAWSISVKAVGNTLVENEEGAEVGEKNFTVQVSPNEDLSSLYEQIEGVTGLKASQQRLIYRGRLIGSNERNETKHNLEVEADCKPKAQIKPKIKDIVGLCDGQTIHLVKKKETAEPEQPESGAASRSTSAGTSTSREDNLSGSGGASLLAALIGLRDLEDGDSNGNGTTTAGGTTTTNRHRVGWRSSRFGRSRRPHYRLTAEDHEVSDPGNMEPVRQGLMTLHTMVPHAGIDAASSAQLPSPLEASRQWYRGQWIDCRDTVNQWLEATIVDIVLANEILPNNNRAVSQIAATRILEPAVDPAVSANDLEGRMKLLLEPCDEDDEEDEGGELKGFKRRANNEGVQLLLIHYNGWPHRWDEWIRSDSERIRPFRTRTRHPNSSSSACPTPQSLFHDAPSTSIVCNGDDRAQRAAILPELHRVLSAVEGLLATTVEESNTTRQERTVAPSRNGLPWCERETIAPAQEPNAETPLLASPEANVATRDAEIRDGVRGAGSGSTSSASLRRRQLQMLAPLLDRLGRTLMDVSPHLQYLASEIPDEGRSDLPTAQPMAPQDALGDNSGTLGGLLSLLSRDRRRQSVSSSDDPVHAITTSVAPWPVDPDYIDFATGSVNTTRGEVRSGPRSRAQNDDMAGLLGAYIAAASLGGLSNDDGADTADDNGNILGLGRILRDRGAGAGGGGGGGAGIDIHIHAFVTAPGATNGGGGLGLTTVGGPQLPTAIPVTRTALSSERRGTANAVRLRTPALVQDNIDEDMDLFSDLYSENPTPVNPNGNPGIDSEHANVEGTNESNVSADTDPSDRRSSRQVGTQNFASSSESAVNSPSRLSATGSDASGRRSPSSGSRRGSFLGRLFRRSRRSSN